MDMSFIMAPQKKNWSGEYYVDLLRGGPTHESILTSPLIEDIYLDAHQRAKKGKKCNYQEDKSQYDDKISEPPGTHVNATFIGN